MAAMNAADPAGGHEPDARHRRGAHRRCNGGGAGLLMHECRTEVARRYLHRAGRDALDFGPGQTDLPEPVEHADGGRHRALIADGRLAAEGSFQVVRGGQSLADDRRLERDHRPPALQGFGHLGGKLQKVAHAGRAPTLAPAAAATRTACSPARCGPSPDRIAMQKAAANASPAPLGSTTYPTREAMRRA